MTRLERLRLCAEVGLDPRSVRAWELDPTAVKSTSDYALRSACAKLGIPLPAHHPRDDGPAAPPAA